MKNFLTLIGLKAVLVQQIKIDIMKIVTLNREVPNYHSLVKFYLTPIGSFIPWKYVDRKRLDQIFDEAYRNGSPLTRSLINKFYDEQD